MFDLKEKKRIPLLGVEAQIYEHSSFSCKHIHLDCESNEKSFVVAFRTIPKDSTGIAHILEHTVLCGSKRYPVRDPFFMMIRRSLSTFMNAMTSQDTTMYPFSSVNDQDFKNLLDVYLDATFFPNLNELDFMQEGHRYEIEKGKNNEEKLLLKGVVYNEMIGAMSSVPSQLYQGLSEFLYPKTTYKYNSGGDPEVIPELTYRDLVSFHKKHYHPSNAYFFSHGKLEPEFLQNEIENKVLKHFSSKSNSIRIESEVFLDKPFYASKAYKPFPDDIDNHHVLVSWLMEHSKNPVDHLGAELLENILLDNSASPLRKALEGTGLGKTPSPIMGLGTSKKQMYFIAGLEGVGPDKEKDVEKLILDVFKKLVKEGVPDKLVEASLHQIEISQRVIGGQLPYGLSLLLGVMPQALNDANPIKFLDLEDSLGKLKERLEKTRYLEELIERFFLNNNHRLTFQLVPDVMLDQKKEKKHEILLSEKLSSLTENAKKKIGELTAELEKRQNLVDDENLLPCVKVKDVSKERVYPACESISEEDGIIKYHYKTATNGVDYGKNFYQIKNPTFDDLKLSSFFSNIITEVGVGKNSYEKIQQEQSITVGNIGAQFFLPDSDIVGQILGIELGGYSLQRNFSNMKSLMQETISGFRLDEMQRIEELVEIHIAGREKSITQSGHIYAMSSVSSQLSSKGAVQEAMTGLSALHNMKTYRGENGQLDIDCIVAGLNNLRGKINLRPNLELKISTESKKGSDIDLTKTGLESLEHFSDFIMEDDEIAWITESGVNFCAQAFPTVGYDHPDSPVLAVLGKVLHNGYLHSAIREKGGAYGSGAMQDVNAGLFKFFSYRDPNTEETFNSFNASIEWAVKSITENHLEQGILGIISSIDKPASPSSEAMADLYANLSGRTSEKRKNFRDSVIQCTVEKLNEVTKKYLMTKPRRALVSGRKFEKQLTSMGFTIRDV